MPMLLSAGEPVLPKDAPGLILPKGKLITVSGMTMKGGVPEKQKTSIACRWNDQGLTITFDCIDAAIAEHDLDALRKVGIPG